MMSLTKKKKKEFLKRHIPLAVNLWVFFNKSVLALGLGMEILA